LHSSTNSICRSAILLPTPRFLGRFLLLQPDDPALDITTTSSGFSGEGSSHCTGVSNVGGGAAKGAWAGVEAAKSMEHERSARGSMWMASSEGRAVRQAASGVHAAPPPHTHTLSCQQLLLASLICNVGRAPRVLELPKHPLFQV